MVLCAHGRIRFLPRAQLCPSIGGQVSFLGTSDAKKPAILKVLVGAVGIELSDALKMRKLLILDLDRNDKIARYKTGTQD